ncbi:MAG: endonuclease/exonuclease/phosphatase family protein [Spirochaetota bacterium]
MRLLKWMGILVGSILGIFILTLVIFTVAAYRPAPKIKLENISPGRDSVKEPPRQLEIMTWNLGYCALDKHTDFVMEGGRMSRGRSKKAVVNNLKVIVDTLEQQNADIYFLQEADRNSARSFRVDQVKAITRSFDNYRAWFATNYKAIFVPYPSNIPIGKVHSGILTLSRWNGDVWRYQLPGRYAWPTRIFHLKRCISVLKIPAPENHTYWYLINLHLSAYDAEGALRKRQLRFVKDMMVDLYRRGNYVVLGGDWNCLFPGVDMESFTPYTTPDETLGWVQEIPPDWTPRGWRWAYDPEVPTTRTLEQPYENGENFTTIIDGFLLSPNVELLEVKGSDLGFVNTDHNPVWVRVRTNE